MFLGRIAAVVSPMVVVLLAARSGVAEVAASFSLPQTPTGISLVNGLDGYDFTPTENLTVTALGWYDHGGDGLSHDHPVAIYITSTEALAAPSATVMSSDPLDATADFRYVSVTPFTLLAGTQYTLTGFGAGPNFDPYIENPAGGVTFGPDFSVDAARSGATSGLQFPTDVTRSSVIQAIFFGPNFEYSVPEPASASMVGVAALALAGRRRRARIG